MLLSQAQASLDMNPSKRQQCAAQASLMMRLVDDFLVLTPSRAAAEAIVRRATRGERPARGQALPSCFCAATLAIDEALQLTHASRALKTIVTLAYDANP